jgi:hypothetical protein
VAANFGPFSVPSSWFLLRKLSVNFIKGMTFKEKLNKCKTIIFNVKNIV